MQQVDSDETFGLAQNLLPSTKTEDLDDAVYSLKEDDDVSLDDETAAALVSAVERWDIKPAPQAQRERAAAQRPSTSMNPMSQTEVRQVGRALPNVHATRHMFTRRTS